MTVWLYSIIKSLNLNHIISYHIDKSWVIKINILKPPKIICVFMRVCAPLHLHQISEARRCNFSSFMWAKLTNGRLGFFRNISDIFRLSVSCHTIPVNKKNGLTGAWLKMTSTNSWEKYVPTGSEIFTSRRRITCYGIEVMALAMMHIDSLTDQYQPMRWSHFKFCGPGCSFKPCVENGTARPCTSRRTPPLTLQGSVRRCLAPARPIAIQKWPS